MLTEKTIQHAKHSASMRHSQLTRPTGPNKCSSQPQEAALREKTGLYPMKSRRNCTLHAGCEAYLDNLEPKQTHSQTVRSTDKKPKQQECDPRPHGWYPDAHQKSRTSSLTDRRSPLSEISQDFMSFRNAADRSCQDTLRGSWPLPYQPDIRRGKPSRPKQMLRLTGDALKIISIQLRSDIRKLLQDTYTNASTEQR